MLTPWRNHLQKCTHRDQGRAYVKCSCPVWADGTLNGQRYRKSLDTRDWARAIRKMAELEDPTAPRLNPKTPEHEYARHQYDTALKLLRETQKRYDNESNPLRRERLNNKITEIHDGLEVLQIRFNHVDDCLGLYTTTIDKKTSDLTTREIDGIKACKTVDLYPPAK